MLVRGNARLIVTKEIEFKDGASDDDGIEFDEGARLALYSDGTKAKFVGAKDKKKNPLSNRLHFNGGGNATNFMFFGTDKLKELAIGKTDDFTGIIYAPNAEIKLKAGSIKYYKCNVQGAIIGKKVELEKNANFHYDENVANLESEAYVVESWNEIVTPTTL